MMNSTNFVSPQQNLISNTDTVSGAPFSVSETDPVEFQHLMRDNEQSIKKMALRDDAKRDNAETDGSLSDMSGIAMNLRSIELNVPQNLPKPSTTQSVHESSDRPTEKMAGERIERKDGDAQEDKDQSAKAEMDETSDSVEFEEIPDNEVAVESLEKEGTPGESQVETDDLALDHETVDDLDIEEIMEDSELNPEVDQIEEPSGENPILEPEMDPEPETREQKSPKVKIENQDKKSILK